MRPAHCHGIIVVVKASRKYPETLAFPLLKQRINWGIGGSVFQTVTYPDFGSWDLQFTLLEAQQTCHVRHVLFESLVGEMPKCQTEKTYFLVCQYLYVYVHVCIYIYIYNIVIYCTHVHVCVEIYRDKQMIHPNISWFIFFWKNTSGEFNGLPCHATNPWIPAQDNSLRD